MSRIAIIGAGAAGCFAAANIPPGHEVVVFEKAGKAMQKVRVSGGGRCNVTHACFDVPTLLTRYPRGKSLLKRSLYAFGPRQTIDWFRQQGVQLKEEADGRMFPNTDNSETIITAIWTAMMQRQVVVKFNKGVTEIVQQSDGWELRFQDGSIYECDKVLLACGSIQKPDHWKSLVSLGHLLEVPAPSLFTFNIPSNLITSLMGVSVPEASVKIAGTKIIQSGPLLITHWGFSGPAVLKSSAFAARQLQAQQYQARIVINWLGTATEADLKAAFQEQRQQNGKGMLWSKCPFGLPRRLWEFMLTRAGIATGIRWGELNSTAQQRIIQSLYADGYEMRGKTTFKEEFVTCGGVALGQVNPQTMESKLAPGLFFAGECLDVDGITGGYNFQHAWASGWLAAQNILK
ncbi:MAG: NAD(P)/FAD-dependent oxidoreductase [Bacteroidetes bacterium]|nr:NAD(P)/FAD-dependent oxidoreductase [Bacteroidota bacterium]